MPRNFDFTIAVMIAAIEFLSDPAPISHPPNPPTTMSMAHSSSTPTHPPRAFN